MAGYTRINIKDLENMAAKYGRKGYEARFAGKPLELKESGMGYQKLDPNHRMGFGHKHEVQEEVFVVISGNGKFKLDDEVIDVKAWDAIRIPKDTMRCYVAGAKGMELLIFGAPFTKKNDAQLEQGWWED